MSDFSNEDILHRLICDTSEEMVYLASAFYKLNVSGSAAQIAEFIEKLQRILRVLNEYQRDPAAYLEMWK